MSWALVTGASSGIGAAIAEELASKGYDILLTGRNIKKLTEKAQIISNQFKVKTRFIYADLSEEEGVNTLVQEIERGTDDIEVLVNNAGVGIWGKFSELDIDKQISMLHLNNTALVKISYAALKKMTAKKKGYILNIGSTASFQAVPGMALYSASKIFVLQFSRALAVEVNPLNIQVTCISPGATETSFVESAGMKGSDLEKQAEKFNMKPSDVAKAAVKALFDGKTVFTPGFLNQMNYVASRVLPRKVLENGAAKLYLK